MFDPFGFSSHAVRRRSVKEKCVSLHGRSEQMTEKDLRRLAVAAEVHEVHVLEVRHVVVGALRMVVVVPAVYDMIFWEFS